MRFIFPLVFLLVACTSKQPDNIPEQPKAPTNESAVQSLGKDLDKTDHRVASALVAIEKNADKPKVVVSESRLAQSYLPPPPEKDVQFALERAAKGSEIDYKKQMEFGRKLATAVNVAWERVEADQREAKRVSDLKDTRIKELEAEIKRVKEDADKNIWTLVGAGLFVVGVLTGATLGWRIGGSILACAPLAGSIPYIITSQYYAWIVGSVLFACGVLAVWWLFDKVRDSINSNGNDKQP